MGKLKQDDYCILLYYYNPTDSILYTYSFSSPTDPIVDALASPKPQDPEAKDSGPESLYEPAGALRTVGSGLLRAAGLRL